LRASFAAVLDRCLVHGTGAGLRACTARKSACLPISPFTESTVDGTRESVALGSFKRVTTGDTTVSRLRDGTSASHGTGATSKGTVVETRPLTLNTVHRAVESVARLILDVGRASFASVHGRHSCASARLGAGFTSFGTITP